jgi:hypothetical protein
MSYEFPKYLVIDEHRQRVQTAANGLAGRSIKRRRRLRRG